MPSCMPYSGGLKRNIVQCLDDYGIPLKLSHTVIDIQGKERVDRRYHLPRWTKTAGPSPEQRSNYSCDTLLLSVGLIPENELSQRHRRGDEPGDLGAECQTISCETSMPSGVFACGNVLHVHDLVDYVSEEATLAGTNAAAYVRGGDQRRQAGRRVEMKAENGVRYTVPQAVWMWTI